METYPTETNVVRTGARLLETLTSALYADPIVVFREYVQNAIDSFAAAKPKSDVHKVEILIRLSEKRIVIRDNGDGIPPEKFEEIMMSLGKSPKEGRRDQVGFRGIGRLAGLSFCDKLQFVNKSNPQNPQTFSLNGKEYRKILFEETGGNLDLNAVMGRIKSDSNSGNTDGDWTFEVTLDVVSDELLDCIYFDKPKRGKMGKIPATANGSLPVQDEPTDDFVNSLSMLLPVPYADGFDGAKEIYKKYQEWFGVDLSTREFRVFLNGRQLFKPFITVKDQDLRIIPIHMANVCGAPETQQQTLKTVGLLWMRFDYVFKAVKKNFGIAVRSKNMLVRGGAVLAEEAANSRDAITSYGQYLSAVKGVTGELLLETELLLDNSRRDWFKVDKNSLQLRDQLCQLMNRMHTYRYKISRYMHNDMRTDAEKQQVIDAYRELVAQKTGNSDVASIAKYMENIEQSENAIEKNNLADARDILGYTTTEKRFYTTLMMSIYDYFKAKEDITDFFSLKSHVLRTINRGSVDPEIDDSSTGDT